ncbi:Na+/H+ antiporter subunit E [Plantactinospora endophytica]|uniref:Na+/H+ antiporter subunit E n=1 Tax=Plantactinospora endophytica TaxID=673535 RepID=A0ABQ4DWA4_9ACTN|nr:Na+/H+ antiporter subunit E [Plantactinospora endophytica]
MSRRVGAGWRALRRRLPQRRRWRDHLFTVGWLVAVWSLLWGEFTWGNLLGGAVVAVVILVFLPLPRVTFGGRLRPLALAEFVGRFVAELVVASVHVGWVAVRPGRSRLRNAIIAVRLRVRTDLNLALTAEVLSLVPGTLIVEADRAAGTLYVHVLDVRGAEDLTRSRDRVLALEARLVRSVGSDAELRMVSAPTTTTTTEPGGSP